MTFAARYPGRCDDCSERIHEGDLCRFNDDDRVAHVVCIIEAAPVASDSQIAEPAPCSTCWLTHPKGSCDRE